MAKTAAHHRGQRTDSIRRPAVRWLARNTALAILPTRKVAKIAATAAMKTSKNMAHHPGSVRPATGWPDSVREVWNWTNYVPVRGGVPHLHIASICGCLVALLLAVAG